jgi:long-chain acyl-CoA synthetase
MQAIEEPRPWLKFYPADVPPTIDYPKKPLFSLLAESASKYPLRIALSYQGRNISYAQLNELANQFANGLHSLGIGKGSKIALILPNLPQTVFSFYGALKAGVTAVPCNPLYRERELEFQLQNSEVEAVVLLENTIGPHNYYEEFGKCRPRLSKVKYVFVTSVTDFLPPIKKQLAGPVKKIKTLKPEGTIRLVDFLNRQSRAEPDTASMNIDPVNDLAVIQYTGGTTGISKGAMLTHYNLLSNAIASAYWSGLTTGSDSTTLAAIPFFHIYGLTSAMNTTIYGAHRIVILPQFLPKEVLATIQKEKVTVFPGVPTMYIALLNNPELGKYSLRSIKSCLSGAAGLPLEVQKKFNSATGGNVVEGYGLTEASPVTHANPLRPLGASRAGSIGIPFPDTDAKIMDIETGTRDMKIGEIGELAVKGPQVMRGYWKSPEETKNVLRDGWLFTGDIAKRDEDGYFYIVDRKKDMVDASGFKVYPREVEEVLFMHPDIKEAAVIGVPDEYRGETVMAFVVLKDKNKNPGVEAIKSFCKEKLAQFKVPKIVEFKDDLPKSLVGKVLRRKLREEQATKS